MNTTIARAYCVLCALSVLVGCGAGAKPAPAPSCDQSCQDDVAVRAMRTAMRFAFNKGISAMDVGPQNVTLPCLPNGDGIGSVRIFGDAEANADQGASFLSLTYDFENCFYSAPPSATADENYAITMTGVVTEAGTLSQQPSATTALTILSTSLSVSGTVYDPPLDYQASACAFAVNQTGNDVAGFWCERAAGFTF